MSDVEIQSALLLPVPAAEAAVFAGVPRFFFVLDRVRWFGEPVVWLGPSDESPFRA